MSLRCKLISTINNVPNQEIVIGESLTIGRNRKCKIKDLKCSRSFCDVTFDGHNISVKNKETDKIQTYTNGQMIEGPGFKYKIVMIAPDISNSKDSLCKDNAESNDTDDGTERKNDDSHNDTTKWESLFNSNVLMCHFRGGGIHSPLIAAFDFDGTLVNPKSGAKFPLNADDWKLIDGKIISKIGTLINDGFRFVLITNQKGISSGHQSIDDIKKRIESALKAIGYPCLALIATADDIYRKPRPGLWRVLESNNGNIDMVKSLYIGDAAGRISTVKGKSDHSAADLLLAHNLGLHFQTPEQFLSDLRPVNTNKFINDRQLKLPKYDPKKLTNKSFAVAFDSNKQFSTISELTAQFDDTLHMIVMCGLPASGKSTFSKKYLKDRGYGYISRDQLKTMEKCEREAETMIKNKKNCVVDNTNVDVSSRMRWTKLCEKMHVKVLLFHFDVTIEHVLHNNTFRRLIGYKAAPTEILIRSLNKKFVVPSKNEGFSAIYKINFLPQFDNHDHEKLYFMILSEK